MTTFWIDAAGNLIKATSDPDAQPPGAVTSTTVEPENGRQKWNGTGWDLAPPVEQEASLGDVWGALKGKFPQLTDADLPAGKKPPKAAAAL